MGAGPLVEVMNVLAVQMGKIDKFTKSQLSTLKKRVKTLREQVKDVKRPYVYVDGFNLYYRALRKTKFKWLNLEMLMKGLLSPDNESCLRRAS